MKKLEYARKSSIPNIDMSYVLTIIFLLIGILFNIYVCQCILGIRR
ncbi:hypothetical protein SAMN05421659_11161 [[Clostridium] fimetarium]|uniref:Uncharacterized protein n=1 Tax=[Clostridium] fimetarium TaxID=99656 RepID=A0A1I0R3A5_9FIRM|nr:hypothetical protein SAMN05421659_11161 [[Clostridium] fimetarium]